MKKLLLISFIIVHSNIYPLWFNAKSNHSIQSTKKSFPPLVPVLKSTPERQYNDLCIFNMEMSDSLSQNPPILTPEKEKNKKESKIVKFANLNESSTSEKNNNQKGSTSTTYKKRHKKKNRSSLDIYFSSFS